MNTSFGVVCKIGLCRHRCRIEAAGKVAGDSDAENVLCMINIDNVALGEDFYFYIDEVETNFSRYISSLFDTSKIGTKKTSPKSLIT